jgi:hypothetical protein
VGIINWQLIGNPINWVTVFLMVAFSAIALTIIMPPAGGDN